MAPTAIGPPGAMPFASFEAWQRRRRAREAQRAGDPWVCPYCREVHPSYEVGGTRFGFGYPSVKLACCGKVAFQLNDPKSGELMRFTRIGDGVADWMPKEQYFAWYEEQSKARGRREASPHKELLANEPPRTPRARPQAAAAQAVEAPPAPAPAAAPAPEPAKPLAFLAVAKAAEVPHDRGKVVVVNGRRLALFRAGADIVALDDTCAHAGRSLGEGALEEGVVTCHGHGWRYDVRSGRVEHNPALGVRSYPVKVEGEHVLVGL